MLLKCIALHCGKLIKDIAHDRRAIMQLRQSATTGKCKSAIDFDKASDAKFSGSMCCCNSY